VQLFIHLGYFLISIMPGPNNKSTHRVFGQATRYQRQFGGGGKQGGGRGSGKSHSRIRTDVDNTYKKEAVDEITAAQRRRAARERALKTEERLGVLPLAEGATERGWLYNLVSTTVRVEMTKKGRQRIETVHYIDIC